MIAARPLAAETPRGLQLERLIRLAQFLRSQRMPLPIDCLARDFRNATGFDWCERTIYRDLQLLERVSCVRRGPAGWKWSAAGGLFDQPAESFGQARDDSLQAHWRFREKSAAF